MGRLIKLGNDSDSSEIGIGHNVFDLLLSVDLVSSIGSQLSHLIDGLLLLLHWVRVSVHQVPMEHVQLYKDGYSVEDQGRNL